MSFVRLQTGFLVLAATAAAQSAAPHFTAADGQQFLRSNCAGCHSAAVKSGGLAITTLDAVHPERDAAKWERVALKLRSGMMPPAGAPRPTKAAVEQFASSIEAALDRAAAESV